jgi:hypothetical protein
VSVPTPGSIHEGGELGYVLTHAFGAAFDNPNLIVAAVVGDGEAETGPLATSWQGIKFLNPARDGAVLPILHLNGYKIGGPTILGRAGPVAAKRLIEAHGYTVYAVDGDDPMQVHRDLAATLDRCHAEIRAYQRAAGEDGSQGRVRRPAIVLRTLKGWTGPHEVDGELTEGTFRSHQVPLSAVRENPEHLKLLEAWLRRYRPDELFDADGRFVAELAALAPSGNRRMGANLHANGGRLLLDLDVPPIADYSVEVKRPATIYAESTRRFGMMLRDVYTRNAAHANFRLLHRGSTARPTDGGAVAGPSRPVQASPGPPSGLYSPRDGGYAGGPQLDLDRRFRDSLKIAIRTLLSAASRRTVIGFGAPTDVHSRCTSPSIARRSMAQALRAGKDAPHRLMKATNPSTWEGLCAHQDTGPGRDGTPVRRAGNRVAAALRADGPQRTDRGPNLPETGWDPPGHTSS